MKRLYKSRKNKVVDGVCGGIAEYFDVDPVLVRIIFVLFFFVGGSALIAYIVGMIIMPRAPYEPVPESGTKAEKQEQLSKSSPPAKPARTSASPSAGSLVIGIIMIILGGVFLLDNLDFPFFHRFFWWFKFHFWEFFIPGILIVVGLVLIMKSKEK